MEALKIVALKLVNDGLKPSGLVFTKRLTILLKIGVYNYKKKLKQLSSVKYSPDLTKY